MKLSIDNFKTFYYFLLFFLSVGAFYPFVHNFVLFPQFTVVISLAFICVWFLTIVVCNNFIVLPKRAFNRIVLVQVFFFAIAYFVLDSPSVLMVIFYLILSWIFLLLVINSFSINTFIKYFTRFNIVSAFFCFLGVILFSIGLLGLIGSYEYQGEFNIYNYGLFFVKRTQELSFQLRPAGYYDEPGSFAFVIMFLLLINRKFFNNRKWEYSLLFFPLATLSLAHIVTVLVFCLYYYVSFKSIGNLIVFCLFIFSLLYTLNLFSHVDSIRYVKDRSVGRIENIISGGDDVSRQGGLEQGFSIFLENPWGYPKEKVKEKFPDFVNEVFWSPLIYYGIFGIGFYLLPFIYISIRILRSNNRKYGFFLFVVVLNLLQRPFYIYPLFLILIYFLFFVDYNKLSNKVSYI
ncbi:hypothetical protein [Cyclobacterium salsum]|uniref:hypothetical protein n=1 Tax=Cyclobacterium salsum TaxID=2666329 RepID=UPI001390BE5D|nr:hypothetical protein [Cyclobacterium salsum]